MLGNVLGAVVGIGALLSWLYAVYHWFKALGHRRPDIALSAMLLHGMKAFDGANFTEQGQPHVRGFIRGFGAFFVCILAGMGVVFIKIAEQG
jgi:hypothetical protein